MISKINIYIYIFRYIMNTNTIDFATKLVDTYCLADIKYINKDIIIIDIKDILDDMIQKTHFDIFFTHNLYLNNKEKKYERKMKHIIIDKCNEYILTLKLYRNILRKYPQMCDSLENYRGSITDDIIYYVYQPYYKIK